MTCNILFIITQFVLYFNYPQNNLMPLLCPTPQLWEVSAVPAHTSAFVLHNISMQLIFHGVVDTFVFQL